MLHQDTLHTLERPAQLQPTRLTIDEILARRQRRLDQRVHQFPPDFLHGDAQIGEVYPVLGRAWVEDVLFLELFRDEEGDLAAWSAAWFDDEFLTIEQAVRDDRPDFMERLDELLGARRRVIELMIDKGDAPVFVPGSEDMAMRCELGRLIAMEQVELAVFRDKDIADARAIYSQREEILQDSRTNLMSLICLCARLVD